MHRDTIDRRATQRRLQAAAVAARALAAALLLAACGGADEAAETEPDVNAIEAVMAIDDVRVAGVPLAQLAPAGPVPATVDAAAASAAASGGPQGSTGARPAEGAAGTAAEVPSPPAVSAARDARTPAARPLAQLQPGAPLVVDMEVADATAGSEVGVVWYAPNGREVWRQKRAVGDEPRLGFSADTTGWPIGLYRGEIHYGRVPVHQFAVQIGTPAPQVIVRGEGLDQPEPGRAGQPRDASESGAAATGRTASAISPTAPASPAAGEGAAAREASAAPTAPTGSGATAAPAAPAEPAAAAPADSLPVDEGAPVVRVPPDDPNMVAPEGPPGPAPEAPPEEPDQGAGDDEPPGGAV